MGRRRRTVCEGCSRWILVAVWWTHTSTVMCRRAVSTDECWSWTGIPLLLARTSHSKGATFARTLSWGARVRYSCWGLTNGARSDVSPVTLAGVRVRAERLGSLHRRLHGENRRSHRKGINEKTDISDDDLGPEDGQGGLGDEEIHGFAMY